MADALPDHIRLKLEQTLAQWRHWDVDPPLCQAPTVVSRLSAGISNYSVLVESGKKFVVRLDGISPSSHGLNRQGEWRSLGAAHRAGLAPRPCYFNPELGSLVCDYLPPDEQQAVDVTDIARLLQGIHRLPARHLRLDLRERILSYEKKLAHHRPSPVPELASCRQAVAGLLTAVDANPPQQLVLCHNDLLHANRLYSGGTLYALDWEYSAMGNPWYDLAVVIAGDNLAPAAAERLLQAYAGRPATALELQLVQQFSCIYRYLELLWYWTLDRAAPGETALDEKLKTLRKCLEATAD